MARRSRGGRVTPKTVRPRNWQNEPNRPSARKDPPLLPILLALGELITRDHLTHDDFGIPQFDLMRTSIRDDIRMGVIEPPVSSLVAEILDDQEMHELAGETAPKQPGWVEPWEILRSVKFTGTVELCDDGYEMGVAMCGLEFESGESFFASVVIDRLGGNTALDAYIGGGPFDKVLAEAAGQPRTLTVTNDPRAVKTTMTEAIDSALMTIPQPSSTSWQEQLLLVRWAVNQIPGSVPEADDWEPALDSAGIDAHIANFLASPERDELTLSDERISSAIDLTMDFKLGYGNNDAHRWGPGQVEIFLADWVLRKIMGPDRIVLDIIEVLPRLIQWSHRITDAPPELTGESLMVTVDEASETRRRLREDPDRLKGVDALMDTMFAEMIHDGDEDDFFRRQMVGSEEALETLDANPLPIGESLLVDDVPEDFQSSVTQIATLASAGAVKLVDEEMGTAAARVATHLGELIPDVLAKGKPESAAAAILIIALRANGQMSITKKAIAEAVGSKPDFTGRAHTFSTRVGWRFSDWNMALGSPRFLVGSTRQSIIDGEI